MSDDSDLQFGEPPAPPVAAGPPEPLDVSPAACLALSAHVATGGAVQLTPADALRLAAGATAACALARSRILRATGRLTEALGLQRAAWRLAGSRREALALTFEAAAFDEDFARAIADADGARDRGQWNTAEQQYGRALAMYPLHFGYRVQYGHMLKEQERFLQAEIAYRDAIVLGAPAEDVAVHLRFVCERQEKAYTPAPSAGADQAPMAMPPSSHDVATLAHLFWHEPAVGEVEHALMLAECPTCEDVALRMMHDRRFARRNRLLLRMLRDGG